MNELTENLSHAMRGAALMFYILLSAKTFPERNENNFKKILFWSMVFLCILVLKDMMFLVRDVWDNRYFCSISMLADLLYVPLMALFFFEAVSPGWIRPKRVIAMFFPVAAALVLYAIHPDENIVRIVMIYIVLFGIAVIAVILMAISRRNNRIKDYFSDISDISVTWIWKALCTLLASLLAWTVLMWKSTYIGDALYFLVSICCWCYIYCLAVRHKVVEIPCTADDVPEGNSLVQEPANGDISGCNTVQMLRERLAACMDEEEIFLNQKLTLQDLASAVGTNRTYLSDFLNKTLDTTFYEYVNGYRARKAASLIRHHPEKKFTEIAELSGYNSLSTFYRSFTKTAGMTPARFKERQAR